VRIEQVVGRARRICSHEDLPPEMRTVQVFLYLSVFSEKQKTDQNYLDLMNKDVSRLNENVAVTTDETLYEISVRKDRISQDILKVVKQTSVDCAVHQTGKDGKEMMCYGENMPPATTNDFISFPSMEEDAQVKTKTVTRTQTVAYREVTIQGKKYMLNESTHEIYNKSGFSKVGDNVPIGKLVKEGKRYKLITYGTRKEEATTTDVPKVQRGGELVLAPFPTNRMTAILSNTQGPTVNPDTQSHVGLYKHQADNMGSNINHNHGAVNHIFSYHRG